MKIAFLNIYNGVIDRGAETFVKELAGSLSKKHEVVVFQSGEVLGNEKYRIERIQVNWDWSKKSGVGTLAGYLFIDYWNRQIFIFAIKAFVKMVKEKFDIIIPVNGGWLPAVMRIATWIYGGRMIISGQSGIGWDDRNNLWCFPNVFISLSTFAKKWARRVNPLVRVEYISNGVDTKKFFPGEDSFETKLKSPIVVTVGALIKSKRIDLAIKAVGRLKNVSLLVAGDGELRDETVKLGENTLGPRFQLIKVPYNEMPKVYRCADIFSLVSESHYSFENVLVEAMATGLPVVANNDPIRREIVGDAGILVDPTNTEAYSKALTEALNKNWGDKPRKQAEKFDWDKIAQAYERLFKSLFASKQGIL